MKQRTNRRKFYFVLAAFCMALLFMPALAWEASAETNYTYDGKASGEAPQTFTFTEPISSGTDLLSIDTTQNKKYYLTDNITIDSTWNINGGSVYLDLNGYSIELTGADENNLKYVIMCNSASFYLFDSSGTDAGKITGGYNTSYGSGIYCSDSDFFMYGGSICDNQTTAIGAGVFMWGGNFTMYGGDIHDNTAGGSGGGVANFSGGTFTMYGGNIHNNTAESGGGGIFNMLSSTVVLNGGNISYNTASQGGGICNDYGIDESIGPNNTVIINGGEISYNTATPQADTINIAEGGGIYNTGSASSITMTGAKSSEIPLNLQKAITDRAAAFAATKAHSP